MVMSSLSAGRKRSFLSRLRTLLTFQNFNHTAGELCPAPVFQRGEIDFSKWRKLDARKMGLNQSMIPPSPWIVLKILQNAGFEAYFVGGCVRDLLLNRVPKDFDVITTAALAQVRKKFHRSIIVGRRFPICQVRIKGCIVEVSSFETAVQQNKGKENFSVSRMPRGCDEKDLVRWRDSLHRDFTVNSLFFDPFVNKIYDYANALSDLKLSKLRTLIPAQLSFEEDCARILRGLRLAARLGLSFSDETESAIHKLSSSILSLAKSRILMELNYMLSYGAAEPSLSLLQRFHLLDILLPVQAAILSQQARKMSSQSPLMLMKLFSNLDNLVTCDRPADGLLWVAILAFHLALIKNPQHALVVQTFASVLYHGKWKEGVKYARGHAQEVHNYIPEISTSSDSISNDELAEKVTELALLVQRSVDILTEADILLDEMGKFPGVQSPGFVFVPKKLGESAKNIFDMLVRNLTSLKTKRESLEINYDSLKKGHAREARFVLGKIILQTLGCEIVPGGEVIMEEKHELHSSDSQKNVEVLEENCHAVVDQTNYQSWTKTDKKRSIVLVNFEEEEKVAKKQKFTRKDRLDSGILEQITAKSQMVTDNKCRTDIAEKKQGLVEDNSSLKMAKNHQKLSSDRINYALQGYAGNMQQKADSHQVPREDIRMMLETLKHQVGKHEVSVKKQKADNQEHKQNAEQHLKLLEQVSDDVSKKQQKSEGKCLVQQESDVERQNVVVEHLDSNVNLYRKALDKGVNHKRERVKLRRRPRVLSSLFK